MISELVPSFYTSNRLSDYIDQLRSFDFAISVIQETGAVPLQMKCCQTLMELTE
jgi:hypothetical protein